MKKWLPIGMTLLLCVSVLLTACTNKEATEPIHFAELTDDKLVSDWPNAVFYEIFVRAFYDSNGDGIGDIKGMTEKLDYLKELGVEGLWLMPVNPSPSYHKYDVTNYYDIDPEYGTMDDFKTFVKEAHARDIKVIMDLVVNHTSKDHPWFKEALASKDSPYRDWYLWANDKTNLSERGEWGQGVWHGRLNNKYLGVFWEGMPDLNFDHPDVRAEMIKSGKFWLEEAGVDGFRLDAAKHIYTEHEKNHEWWQEFRAEMQAAKEDVFLVGEVWDAPSIVGHYFKDGLHATFNFELGKNIINAVRSEGGSGIASFLENIRTYYKKQSEDFTDATIITNHDMNRTMSELLGDKNKAKMASSLLLTLPGSPFIYYGEEIGMEGVKPDEHIREPFLWSKDAKGTGQTTWVAAKHNLGDKATSVEAQLADTESLYTHYKTMIHVRRSSNILVSGEITPAEVKEKGIIAFHRILGDQSLLVIHNVSDEMKKFNLGNDESVYSKPYFSSESTSKTKATKKQIQLEIAPYSTLILQQD